MHSFIFIHLILEMMQCSLNPIFHIVFFIVEIWLHTSCLNRICACLFIVSVISFNVVLVNGKAWSQAWLHGQS